MNPWGIEEKEELENPWGIEEKKEPGVSKFLRGVKEKGPGLVKRELGTALEFLKFPYTITKELTWPMAKATAKLPFRTEEAVAELGETAEKGKEMATGLAAGGYDWLRAIGMGTTPAEQYMSRAKIGERVKEHGVLAESVHPLILMGISRGFGVRGAPKRAKVPKLRPEAEATIPLLRRPEEIIPEIVKKPKAKKIPGAEELKAKAEIEKAIAEKAVGREPWEMTKEEFVQEVRAGHEFPQLGVKPTPLKTLRVAKDFKGLDQQARQYHEGQTISAFAEGKPVPPEVLKDYPELKPKAPAIGKGKITGKELYELEKWQKQFGTDISYRTDLEYGYTRGYHLETDRPSLIVGTKGASVNDIKLSTLHEVGHVVANQEGPLIRYQNISNEYLQGEVNAWHWAIKNADKYGVKVENLAKFHSGKKGADVMRELRKAGLVKPKPAPGIGKEAWRMTKEEWRSEPRQIVGNRGKVYTYEWKGVGDRLDNRLDYQHLKAVKKAISEGKDVSSEVIESYRYSDAYATLTKAKPKAPAVETKGYGFERAEMHAGITPTEVIASAKEVARLTSEMVEGMKVKPEIRAGVKEAKTAMIEHDTQIRTGEFIHRKMRNTFDRAVVDKNSQLNIVHAVQQKRNPKYYNQLTTQEKGVVKWMELELDKLEAFNRKYEITDIKEMPEGVRYVPGSWLNPKTGKPYAMMYGKFSKGLPQAKQKVFSTYEQGMATGAKMATTNLGDIIGGAWESLVRAQQSREMFKTLHNVGAEKGVTIQLMKGKPTKPIRMVERWDLLQKQGLTEDYTRYSHPALDKAIIFKDVNGALVKLKGAVGVRKELYPFVRSYLESPTYGTFSKLNFATKSLKLGFSMFHVMSLGMQELANFRIPFKNIPRGLREIKNLGEEMRILHKEGLEIFKGYEDVGYRNRFFEGSGRWSKMGNTVTKPIEMMRTFIFDVVQPGMKASFALDKYNELLPKYLKRRLTKEQCARDVVKAADGHFSGEHYKRSLLETNRFMVKMYFTPEARKTWQAALLSPTWQREHLLVAKNVAKSFMPDRFIRKLRLTEMGPVKGEFRKYLLGAAMIISAVDLWNYQSTLKMDGTGLHLWENPEGKGFAVRAPWNEPGYTMIDKNGKERRVQGGPAYIRPLKSVFEVAEWVKTPFKKFVYKLSPIMTATGRQMWPSKYQKEYKGWPDMDQRVWDFITDVGTPISGSQIGRWAVGKKTLPSAIVPFFGAPTSRLDKKQTRERYSKRLADLQKEFGKKSPEYKKVEREFGVMGYEFKKSVYQAQEKKRIVQLYAKGQKEEGKELMRKWNREHAPGLKIVITQRDIDNAKKRMTGG